MEQKYTCHSQAFRIYPNQEQTNKLLKEFDFYNRLYGYLIRKVEYHFSDYFPLFHKIPAKSLRPFVFGIIKRLKSSEKYNFGKYFADDHFAFATENIFSLYEYKKEDIYCKHVFNNIRAQKDVIRLSCNVLILKRDNASFNHGKLEIKIRPKNLYFHNFKYFYLTKKFNKFYLFGEYYKSIENTNYETLACGLSIDVEGKVTIIDSDNNIFYINFDVSKVKKLEDKIEYLNSNFKGSITSKDASGNLLLLNKKLCKNKFKIKNILRHQYLITVKEITKKYKFIYYSNHIYSNKKENWKFDFFIYLLKKYSKNHNRTLIRIDGNKAKKICSKCGAIINENNDNKKIICDCGYVMDVSINEAINLLHLGALEMNKVNSNKLKINTMYKEVNS